MRFEVTGMPITGQIDRFEEKSLDHNWIDVEEG